MVSLYSPNGQFGCLTVRLWRLTVCVGFVPDLFGIDVVWRGRHLV